MNVLAATEPAGVAEITLEACHIAAGVIGLIGVLVIVYGVVRGTVQFVRAEAAGSPTHTRHRLRQDLGFYLLLGLEFLIAADVIETLTAPDLEHLLALGAVVLIRTVISFSLNWELAHHEKQTAPPEPAA